PGIIRKYAAVSLSHLPRGSMQVLGAAVIAEPFPGAKNIPFRGGRQGRQRGKSLDETLVKSDNRRHLRLLQHDLADPDWVGISIFPPWKRAVVSSKPTEEESAKSAP